MKRIIAVAGILVLVSSTAPAQDNVAVEVKPHSLAQNTAIKDTTPPPDMVPVDTQPVPVTRKNPVYPEPALKSGLEGVVWVKVWIDKEGTPKDVQVLKSDNHVFDQASIDAAKGWAFTPAMKDGKPVAVWVTVPFKYRLEKAPDDMKAYSDELKKKIDHPTVSVVRGPKSLSKLIKYPKQASDRGIEGAVFAQATLSDSLTVSDLKLTKSLDRSCDRAVLAGIAGYDFASDKEFAAKKEGGTVSIVVQFVLPAKK